jgi:trk system potassium uptake protein TrkH
MGFVVLSLAILPLLGVGGMELYKAEVPSPTPDRLAPRIADTASVLWKVYAILTALETGALMLCGMDLFDAVCHAFATMATGGFSTMNASVGGYANPMVHYVVTLFMVLAGMNFTLHFHLFRGRTGPFWRDEEWRFYVGVYLVFSLGIALTMFFQAGMGAEPSLRNALFQAATILTTTGFATADYSLWPPAALALLMALMFVGGSAGSTGGGPKCMRVWVILKQTYSELMHLVHPRLVAPVKLNNHVVEPRVIFSIWAFMGLYLALFLLVGIMLTFLGMDTTSALSASIACLGNIGPGLGSVGPAANYAHLPDAAKWLLSMAMIVGRLEIYTVLVLLMPEFWRR